MSTQRDWMLRDPLRAALGFGVALFFVSHVPSWLAFILGSVLGLAVWWERRK